MKNKKNTHIYYKNLAEKHGLDFIDLNDQSYDDSLLQIKDHETYLQLQAIPLREFQTSVLIGTTNPTSQNQKNIRTHWSKKNKTIQIVVIPRQDIRRIISQKFKNEFIYDVSNKRRDLNPIHNASYSFSFWQKVIFIVWHIFLIVLFIKSPYWGKIFIGIVLSAGTTIIIGYKVGLSIRAISLFENVKPKKMPPLLKDETDIPVYTILVPLLREKKEVISYLISSIDKMNYPKEKLDVQLLLEENDNTTLEAVNSFELPWYYDIVIVPGGFPRSKPRACNYGLMLAFGELLGIYDAEDRPHPDQLLTVYKMFAQHPKNVASIQAPLNFYNWRENFLSKEFTIEYTHWYDGYIPALNDLNVPIPLGGTSNHFKTSVLRKIGAWDPYIGTEDAEIGIRLYRHHYSTKVILQNTYEEANIKLSNWFKQRTRWSRGYLQTYLINMRKPWNLIKEIGWFKFIHFQLFIGGNVFIQFANLPLWILLFIITFFNNTIFGMHPLDPFLLNFMWYNFILSNGMLLVCECITTYKRKLYPLLFYVPLRPFYWLLISVSGVWSIFDLLIWPVRWYKTEHGLSTQTDKTDIDLS